MAATAAGGTLPTGMYTCLHFIYCHLQNLSGINYSVRIYIKQLGTDANKIHLSMWIFLPLASSEVSLSFQYGKIWKSALRLSVFSSLQIIILEFLILYLLKQDRVSIFFLLHRRFSVAHIFLFINNFLSKEYNSLTEQKNQTNRYYLTNLPNFVKKWINYFISDGKNLYCPRDFTLSYPMCFGIRSARMNWLEGEEYCSDLPGGHLVAIHTKEQFDIAVDMATSYSRFWQKHFVHLVINSVVLSQHIQMGIFGNSLGTF